MIALPYSDNMNNFSKIVKKEQYIDSGSSKDLLKDLS